MLYMIIFARESYSDLSQLFLIETFYAKLPEKLVFFEGTIFLVLIDTTETSLSCSFDIIFSTVKTKLKEQIFQHGEK